MSISLYDIVYALPLFLAQFFLENLSGSIERSSTAYERDLTYGPMLFHYYELGDRQLLRGYTLPRGFGPVRWSELWLKLTEKHCSC